MRQITLKKPVASVSSLGGSARVVFAATFACFMSAASLSAQGSTNVFNDAVFWFRGGKDLNGDGYMRDQGEFFDDLHADDPTHNNHKMAVQTYTSFAIADGFKYNAVFRTESVVFPALGRQIVKNVPVLNLSNNPVEYSSKSYFWPQYVKPYSLFANNNISNEYTVVSRLRLDEEGRALTQCLLRIGYNSSAKKGLMLGFAPCSGLTNKYITAFCTPNESGKNTQVDFDSIQIPTNTWVDVAVVVGNGKLRIGVAAPQTSLFHGNNPTIAFAETNMWTANCTLIEDESCYRLFSETGQTSQQYSSASIDKTYFTGSIQQMAIWKRALTDQEVMEAFGMPRPAIFRTGFDNGASNEFGGTRSGVAQTIDGLGSWQNIANTMKAGDAWTVNFTALRDEAGLPQIFSIKSLDGSVAQIEPVLNGTSLGEGRIAANSRGFWPVAANLVSNGVNTLVIKRKDSRTRDFLMDAMELGGSFGVGTITQSSSDDGRIDPRLIRTGIPSAADPNPQHWPKELEPYSGITNLHLRVWIDPDVADKASFTFKTAAAAASRNATQTATGSEFFSIYFNGNYKSKLKATPSWTSYDPTFTSGDAVLRGGWNDIEFITPLPYSGCRWHFGYFRFEANLPDPYGFSPAPGLTVVVR